MGEGGARGAIEAGKAFVEFLIEDKKFNKGLGAIGQKMQKFGAIGSLATAPLIAGFTAAAYTFASVGSELEILSKRTGLSVESLSELRFAAEQSGISLQQIERAARELQKKGISPKKFDQIAASIAAIQDPTKRAQVALQTFGKRTGTVLLPMLSRLSELRQKARDLGLTLSEEDAEAAHKLENAFGALKMQLTAVLVQIGAAIAGPLTEFLAWSQKAIAATIEWIKENPRLVRAIAAVTLGIAAASAAAVTFGIILAVISAHPIIAALALIAGLVLGVAAYFGLASDAAGDFKKSLDVQAASVKGQLTVALAGQIKPAGVAASGSSVVNSEFSEVVRWTRDSAESLRRLVQYAKNGGLVAGAG